MSKLKFKQIAEVFKVCELTGKPYEFGKSRWETIDGETLTGNPQHAGKRVLLETRANGKTYQHWWYKKQGETS